MSSKEMVGVDLGPEGAAAHRGQHRALADGHPQRLTSRSVRQPRSTAGRACGRWRCSFSRSGRSRTCGNTVGDAQPRGPRIRTGCCGRGGGGPIRVSDHRWPSGISGLAGCRGAARRRAGHVGFRRLHSKSGTLRRRSAGWQRQRVSGWRPRRSGWRLTRLIRRLPQRLRHPAPGSCSNPTSPAPRGGVHARRSGRSACLPVDLRACRASRVSGVHRQTAAGYRFHRG